MINHWQTDFSQVKGASETNTFCPLTNHFQIQHTHIMTEIDIQKKKECKKKLCIFQLERTEKILGPKLDLSIKIKVTNHTSWLEYKRCVGTQPRPNNKPMHQMIRYIRSLLVKLSKDMYILLIDKCLSVEFKNFKSAMWNEVPMHATT